MEQINLDDYFAKNEEKVRICNTPEEIAEAEEINRKMRLVRRQARILFARSEQAARNFYFTR